MLKGRCAIISAVFTTQYTHCLTAGCSGLFRPVHIKHHFLLVFRSRNHSCSCRCPSAPLTLAALALNIFHKRTLNIFCGLRQSSVSDTIYNCSFKSYLPSIKGNQIADSVTDVCLAWNCQYFSINVHIFLWINAARTAILCNTLAQCKSFFVWRVLKFYWQLLEFISVIRKQFG